MATGARLGVECGGAHGCTDRELMGRIGCAVKERVWFWG